MTNEDTLVNVCVKKIEKRRRKWMTKKKKSTKKRKTRMNQSTHKKPHANRTEKRLLWVRKFIILSHSVVPLIHTLSHTHFEYIFIRCCYSMSYSSVCYTAHLYGHKLLKCCIPFSLNKHKEIRQTHSQWDASMLRVITTITIIIITKIEKKQREKTGRFENKIVYFVWCKVCASVPKEKKLNGKKLKPMNIIFSFARQVSLLMHVFAFRCHHHLKKTVTWKQ